MLIWDIFSSPGHLCYKSILRVLSPGRKVVSCRTSPGGRNRAERKKEGLLGHSGLSTAL